MRSGPAAPRPGGAAGVFGQVQAAEYEDRGTSPGPNHADLGDEWAEEQEREVTLAARQRLRSGRGRLLGQAFALRLEKGTSSLLAEAEFAPVDAGMITLFGPSMHDSGVTMLGDDFNLSVHLGSPSTPAIA